MSTPSPSAYLVLHGIRIPVHLGWLPGEQDEPQAVEFDVTVRFAHPPTAMSTDELQDTVDYSAVVHRIKETVGVRKFKLVEHLAAEVFTALRADLADEHALELGVRKVAPPVPELTGGARFVLTG